MFTVGQNVRVKANSNKQLSEAVSNNQRELFGILYDHGIWIGSPDSGFGWVIPSDLHPGQEYNGKRVTITLTVDETDGS